jgi:hypothetical protein
MTTNTPKEDACDKLLTMLNAENRFVINNSHHSEIHGDPTFDPDTARGRKAIAAYRKELRRAAKPCANYLTNRGWDIGTIFPFDEEDDTI